MTARSFIPVLQNPAETNLFLSEFVVIRLTMFARVSGSEKAVDSSYADTLLMADGSGRPKKSGS